MWERVAMRTSYPCCICVPSHRGSLPHHTRNAAPVVHGRHWAPSPKQHLCKTLHCIVIIMLCRNVMYCTCYVIHASIHHIIIAYLIEAATASACNSQRQIYCHNKLSTQFTNIGVQKSVPARRLIGLDRFTWIIDKLGILERIHPG